MTLRTPLSRVRGLGSAKDGTEHWWHQRLTAIANIPLMLGFTLVLLNAIGKSHAEVAALLELADSTMYRAKRQRNRVLLAGDP